MKKVLMSVLSAMMLVTSMVTIKAEDTTWTGSGSDSTVDVNATVSKSVATATDDTDYYVVLSWKATNGTFAVTGDSYQWDADVKKYVRTSDGQGTTLDSSKTNTDATMEITMTNYSNAKVNYTISYASAKNGSTDISTESTASGSKSGTIASYTANITLSDTTGASSIDYSSVTAPSATYKGKITLNSYSSNDYSKITSAQKMGTYTVKLEKVAVVLAGTFDGSTFAANATLGSLAFKSTTTSALTVLKDCSVEHTIENCTIDLNGHCLRYCTLTNCVITGAGYLSNAHLNNCTIEIDGSVQGSYCIGCTYSETTALVGGEYDTEPPAANVSGGNAYVNTGSDSDIYGWCISHTG